eukprot:6192725-Pleurochrysis_carterae.AAC.3
MGRDVDEIREEVTFRGRPGERVGRNWLFCAGRAQIRWAGGACMFKRARASAGPAALHGAFEAWCERCESVHG